MGSKIFSFNVYAVALMFISGIFVGAAVADVGPQIDTRAPSIPSRVHLQDLQSDHVRIAWKSSVDYGGSGVGGYLVYRNYKFLGRTSVPAYSDRTVKPGTTYVYAISAFDNSSKQNHSSLRSVRLRTPKAASVAVATAQQQTHNESQVSTQSQAQVVTQAPEAVADTELNVVAEPNVAASNTWASQATQSQQNLPLGGQFYGTIKGGMMGGNGPIAFSSAIRFRAERTGQVKAMRYNNRTLRNTDIEKRCDLYGQSSVWCACKKAGLDNISCGYTLPNSYHVGSGGLITVELRNDDGSGSHLPGNKVLAVSNAFVPVNIKDKFPTINFTKTAQLEAGRLYHLVFRNDKYPQKCQLKNLSIQQASSCPRNEGAMGLNGTKHASDPSSRSSFGPFFGDYGSGLLFKATANGRWLTRSDVAAFYELQYTNGDYVGDSYTGFDNPNYGRTAGTRTIEGPTIARQAFTVEDASRDVDGLWLQYGHVFDRKVNLKPLRATLKSANGQVLATGTLPASKACNDIAYSAGKNGKSRVGRDDWMCRTWGYTDFSSVVSLIEGQQYSVEFSAPAGAGYNLSTFFSLHRRKSHNDWDNAKAQLSVNNGRSWSNWTNSYTFRDLPVLFTILGMPKHLP